MTPAMTMTMMGGRCEVITYVDVPVFHVDRTVGGRRWTGGHGNKEIEEFDWFISVCFVISLCVSCVNYSRLFRIYIYIFFFSICCLFFDRSSLPCPCSVSTFITQTNTFLYSRFCSFHLKIISFEQTLSRVTFPPRNVLGPLGTDSKVTRLTIVVLICVMRSRDLFVHVRLFFFLLFSLISLNSLFFFSILFCVFFSGRLLCSMCSALCRSRIRHGFTGICTF